MVGGGDPFYLKFWSTGPRWSEIAGLLSYCRLPQTTADYHRLPQTNVHVHRRPKKIAGKRKIDDLHSITDVVHVGPSWYFRIFYDVL